MPHHPCPICNREQVRDPVQAGLVHVIFHHPEVLGITRTSTPKTLDDLLSAAQSAAVCVKQTIPVALWATACTSTPSPERN